MKKEKKNEEISSIKEAVINSKGIFISYYAGLSVEKFNALRDEISANNSILKVSKNTLTGIAFKDTYAGALKDYLKGPNFLVLTNNDAQGCAKVLSKFAKENPDSIKIRAGFYESFLDQDKILVLATLPSKEVLISKFIFIIKSPQVRLVFALKYPQIKLLQVLSALTLKKSQV